MSFSLYNSRAYSTVGGGVILAVISILLAWQITNAASTATVGATVTAQSLSLSVSPGTITYGSVALNTATTTAGHGYTQTVTNTGSTMVLNVKSTDGTGGTTWVLDTSNATLDHYMHEVSTTTGSTYMKMPAAGTYITASSTFPTGAVTQALEFQLTTPNTSSDFVQKTITVTLQASAP
ncbi:MAG: hypothetical protein NTY93_01315 [Candidatus Kaiserbacteria bacterium]|nr:hypothetical protein [Candidatus Kaiserbacteria bacterium]